TPGCDTGKMISGTLITLFCLVRESKAPFKVALGRNNDVSDFKGLRGITLQDNENVTLLDGTNDIVDYWAEEQIPFKKCIHVIVELLGKNKILTSGIAELQLQDKKLWVRYNDERVFLPENILGLLRVFNVGDLVPIIKSQLKIKGDIAIRNGNDILEVGNIEVKRIKNAFHINYQGSALDTFYERLVLFHDEWRAGNKIPNSNDETYFVRWRRQIRNIIWHGFFNVILSTNGKIDNFLPPDTKDTPSARMHDYFLFPAYLDVHTIDALVSLAPIGKSYVPQRTLYLGIPLWGSLAQAGRPSDPILASGALKGIIEVGLENCLDTLLEQFSRGVVEAGERGELVGRISFLEAYIRAVKESQESPYTYLEKVPLPLFLKSLDKKLDNLLTKMELDQAEIGFNHWTSLLASNKDYVKEGGYKYLTAALVKEAYHRHTAFKMPLGFPTIDHVIPFKYSTSNRTDNYGIISIQNKNAKQTSYQDSDVPILVNLISALSRNNFNGIILGIYIDIGTSSSSIEIKEVNPMKTRNMGNNVYCRALYIQHIQSFNCNKEIGERLSKLRFTSPWPLDPRWRRDPTK
ncbi:11942_t:CDS:2, partial [Rhizophagus irregularis]